MIGDAASHFSRTIVSLHAFPVVDYIYSIVTYHVVSSHIYVCIVLLS